MTDLDALTRDGQVGSHLYNGDLVPSWRGLFIGDLGFEEDEYKCFKRDCEDLVKNHIPGRASKAEGFLSQRRERTLAVARYGLSTTWLPKLQERLTRTRAKELCYAYLVSWVRKVDDTNEEDDIRRDTWDPPELRRPRPALARKRSLRVSLGQPSHITLRPDLEQPQPSKKRKQADRELDSCSTIAKESPKSMQLRPSLLSSKQPPLDKELPVSLPSWSRVLLKINYVDIVEQVKPLQFQSISLDNCADIDALARMGITTEFEHEKVSPRCLSFKLLARAVGTKLSNYTTTISSDNLYFELRCYGQSGMVKSVIETSVELRMAFHIWWRGPCNRRLNKAGYYEMWLMAQDRRKRSLAVPADKDERMPDFGSPASF